LYFQLAPYLTPLSIPLLPLQLAPDKLTALPAPVARYIPAAVEKIAAMLAGFAWFLVFRLRRFRNAVTKQSEQDGYGGK
jgi:hypothetical protein